MHSITNIVQLRQLLAERFPNVRMHAGTGSEDQSRLASAATGLAQIDHLLDGGLPKSALTEMVCPAGTAGSASVIRAMTRLASSNRQWMALVDGQDCFDPCGIEREALSHLLWVRCDSAAQALKATDFLARDGNILLIVLDLRLNPARQLQKIAATTWYRFQRCVEPSGAALLVITPRVMVAAAQTRLQLESRLNLDAVWNESVEAQLGFKLLRQHGTDHGVAFAQTA